jgi:hypothetical protein
MRNYTGIITTFLAGRYPKTSEAIYKCHIKKKNEMIVKPIWLRMVFAAHVEDNAVANAIVTFEDPEYKEGTSKIGTFKIVSKN